MFIIHDDDVHMWGNSKGIMHMGYLLSLPIKKHHECSKQQCMSDIQLVHTAGIHGIMNVMPRKAILSIRKYHTQMELAT